MILSYQIHRSEVSDLDIRQDMDILIAIRAIDILSILQYILYCDQYFRQFNGPGAI